MSIVTITFDWMAALRRRDACQLTLEAMRLQTGSAWCPVLETWTFPDKIEPTEKECVRRFRNLIQGYFSRKKDPTVWAFHRGGKRGRPHFHTVRGHHTVASEEWDRSARYGFGRYDVEPIEDREGLFYVARYLARPGSGLREHRQAWGAVCTPRCHLEDVRFGSMKLTGLAEVPSWLLCQFSKASLLNGSFESLKETVIQERIWDGRIE